MDGWTIWNWLSIPIPTGNQWRETKTGWYDTCVGQYQTSCDSLSWHRSEVTVQPVEVLSWNGWWNRRICSDVELICSLWVVFCRIFEFRKIIGDREKCKSLVPKDYPVYINKVLPTPVLSSLLTTITVFCILTDMCLFVSLCPDREPRWLSDPRWVLHLSSGALGSWNPATRGCQSQVQNMMSSSTSAANVMMSQQLIWALLSLEAVKAYLGKWHLQSPNRTLQQIVEYLLTTKQSVVKPVKKNKFKQRIDTLKGVQGNRLMIKLHVRSSHRSMSKLSSGWWCKRKQDVTDDLSRQLVRAVWIIKCSILNE